MERNRLESLFQLGRLHWNTGQPCCSTDYIYLTSPNGQEPPCVPVPAWQAALEHRPAVLQYRLNLPDQSKWTGTALSACSSLAGCTRHRPAELQYRLYSDLSDQSKWTGTALSSCSSLAGCTGTQASRVAVLYLPDHSKWTGTALSSCSSLAGCTGTQASRVAVQIIFT